MVGVLSQPPFARLTLPPNLEHQPINWGHFHQLRTDGDYADYGKEVQLKDFRVG